MTEDSELLAHYIARGREPWNVSLEAAWLDYELRRYVLSRLPAKRPLRVCNVGIGVGLFDDWLGHTIGARITSVDRDPDICRMFELRQRREGHPFPARVLCGDVRPRVLSSGGAREGVLASGEVRQGVLASGEVRQGVLASGEARQGVLEGELFDVICAVGSTLEESGDRGATTRALEAALAPNGVLLVAEVGQGAAADRVQTCGDVWLSCQTRGPSSKNGAPGRPI